MMKLFENVEGTMVKACTATVTDMYGNVIVSYPSLFPQYAVEDAKTIASYWRPHYPFQPISWEVEIPQGGAAKTCIYDVIA